VHLREIEKLKTCIYVNMKPQTYKNLHVLKFGCREIGAFFLNTQK